MIEFCPVPDCAIMRQCKARAVGLPEYCQSRGGEDQEADIAGALEQALAALAFAREALERCYNVTTYPGDGTSRQDQAIAVIDAALGRASPHSPLQDRDANRG